MVIWVYRIASSILGLFFALLIPIIYRLTTKKSHLVLETGVLIILGIVINHLQNDIIKDCSLIFAVTTLLIMLVLAVKQIVRAVLAKNRNTKLGIAEDIIEEGYTESKESQPPKSWDEDFYV